MTDEIRESLNRLALIPPTDLQATSNELNTLLTVARREVESQSEALKGMDTTQSAYTTATSNLVTLLQLVEADVTARAELDKLIAAAGKAVGRVLKKAPK